MSFDECLQFVAQHMGKGMAVAVDAQAAAQGVAEAAQIVDAGIDGFKQRRELGIKLLARFGKRNAARGAVKELDLQALFNRADGMA